jgi:hypothetical protein
MHEGDAIAENPVDLGHGIHQEESCLDTASTSGIESGPGRAATGMLNSKLRLLSLGQIMIDGPGLIPQKQRAGVMILCGQWIQLRSYSILEELRLLQRGQQMVPTSGEKREMIP